MDFDLVLADNREISLVGNVTQADNSYLKHNLKMWLVVGVIV